MIFIYALDVDLYVQVNKTSFMGYKRRNMKYLCNLLHFSITLLSNIISACFVRTLSFGHTDLYLN